MSVPTLMTQSYSLVVWQLVTCCLCAAHYVTLGIAGRPFSHRRGAWDIILKIDKLMVNNNVFYSNYIIMAYYYYKNRMALLCYSFSRIYSQLIHYDWGGITNCSAVLNIKWVHYWLIFLIFIFIFRFILKKLHCFLIKASCSLLLSIH
jgi:hypothetical protein